MALSESEYACENVLQYLKVSRLTYSVQETPFSAYITIRTKFAKNVQRDDGLKHVNTCENFETLTKENTILNLSW